MSQIKELFGGRRVPVPRFVTELFLDDDHECSISNEAEFFENFKRKIPQIMLLEVNAKEYDCWKFLIFRLYEILERRIRSLEKIKSENFSDLEELRINEESILRVLIMFNEIIGWIVNIEEFVFPYFGQLLALSGNPQILNNLVLLSLNILLNESFNKEALVHIANLFAFFTPYMRMWRHYEWRFGDMHKDLKLIFQEKSNLEALLPKFILHEQVAKLFKENSEIGNRTRFLMMLYEKIGAEPKPEAGEDERQKYFKALGEVNLAAFLFEPVLNENILAMVTLMHCLEGLFIDNLGEADVPAKIAGLSLEPCHFHFKYIFEPSIIDVILEKFRELKDTPKQEQAKKIEVLIEYLLGTRRNIDLLKSLSVQRDPPADQDLFYKKLFCIDGEMNRADTKPPVIEMWRIALGSYREYYSTVANESKSLFGKTSSEVKDKINLLTYLTISIANTSISDLTDSVDDENGQSIEVFKAEYHLTICEILEEVIKMFEDYSLQSNYISILLLFAVFEMFREVGLFEVCNSLQIPGRLIKKFEGLVELVYTPNFDAYFKNIEDPEFSFKILKIVCKMFGDIFISYNHGELNEKAKKDYLTHMSGFSTIDLISNLNSPETRPNTEYGRRTQEEIIRYYVAIHLQSQIYTFQDEENAQIVYYNVERLRQVWRLILDYSEYEKYISEEFNMTFDLIEGLNNGEDSEDKIQQVLTSEVVSAVFSKSIFNLDIDYDVKEFETVKEVLHALANSPSWEIFSAELAITLQEKFDSILDEAEALEFLFVQYDPSFIKSYYVAEYRVSEFMKRLWNIIRLMKTYEFTMLANDPSVQSVLSEYLARFINSPIFHLIGLQNGNNLAIVNFIYTMTISNKLFVNIIPHYLSRIPEIIATINQELVKDGEDGNDLFLQKLMALQNSLYSLDKFFVESYFDDPRKIHNANSVLFLPAFLNVAGIASLRDLGNAEILISDLISGLDERLVETTKSLVNAKYLAHLAVMKRDYEANLASFVIVDDEAIRSWTSIPAVKSYCLKKGGILIDLLTLKDESKSFEESFLFRLSAFKHLQELTTDIGFENFLIFITVDQNLENILKSAFLILEDFLTIVSKHLENGKEPHLSGARMSIKKNDLISSEKTLNYLFELVEATVANQFHIIANTLKYGMKIFIGGGGAHRQSRTRINYLDRLFTILRVYLDKIDPKLLSLHAVNDPERMRGKSLYKIMQALYYCYENLLNRISEVHSGEAAVEPPIAPKKKQGVKANPFEKKGKRGRKGFGKSTRGVKRAQKSFDSSEEEEEFENDEDEDGENEEEAALKKAIEEKEEQEIAARLKIEGERLFEKVLEKFTIFFTLDFDTLTIATAYHKILIEFLTKCKEVVEHPEDFRKHGLDDLDLKIYQNPVMNQIRIFSPIVLYLLKFRLENEVSESDHQVFGALIGEYLHKITNLVFKFTPNLKEEEECFIENDFILVYTGFIFSLVSSLKHVIACTLNFKQPLPADSNQFSYLCLAIEKLGEMCQQNRRLSLNSVMLLNKKDLVDVFYYCLQESPERLEKFVVNEKLMNTLIKYLGVQFYVLAEMFILRAYDPEQILKLKLKALVQLDESGSRIFQNVNIKTLEKYWDKTLLEIFEKNFTIENDEDSDNKHSTKKICPKLEAGSESVSMSTLNFLREGMNRSVRILIESIMESIASDTFELIQILFSKESGRVGIAESELRKNIQSQIGYLATMVGTYFEISPLVVSYKLKKTFDFPADCPDLLPEWEPNGTFLSFFIKYNCYLFNFSVGYFLLPFVDKNETPLFIEYGNEGLLLTSYNEWVIFQEIFRVLEETLEKPKNLLTNFYTTSVWNVLPKIAINLLKAFKEAKQKDMKLEIIQRLYSICFKALKVYNLNHGQEVQLKEETHVVYVFLAQLSEIEVGINARNQLFESEKPLEDSLFMRRKLPWILLLLKESGYQIVDGKNEAFSWGEEETSSSEYNTELQKIDHETILSILGEASTNSASVHPNLNNISLAQFPISEHKDLKKVLIKFSHSTKSKEDIFYSFITDNRNNICGLNLQHFGFNGEFNYTSKRSNMFLYPLPPYTKPSITVPKFRIQVKKKLGWHYEKKMMNNVDDQAKELLEGNKEENFDTLIQKMGLENLQKLIRKNKRRVKLLVQQQHEKFLLNKLETILKEQVSINSILCIETNADNIEFYNKQSELDKKLILLLANTDFIESLNEENQKQSKELKKALFNEEKRRKAEDSDDDSSSDSSAQEEIIKPEKDEDAVEEEDDDRGANSGNGLGPRPELKEESDYDSEEEKGDSSKDSIKVIKEKKEKMNREEMENFLKTDSEEDSDVEEVSDFSDNEDDHGVGPKKKNLSEILKRKSIDKDQEEEVKKSEDEKVVSTVENNADNLQKAQESGDDEFEDVSSSCHTEEVSEMNYEGMDDIEEVYEDSEGDEDAMEIDEDSESEGDMDALNYDYLYDIYEDHDENSEVNYFKNFMGEAQKIEKSLIESKFLPRPVLQSVAQTKSGSEEEWVEYVFFLFAYNKKKDALDSDEDPSDMDTYSLFYKFLILSCLDPLRENTTLPLLALYLVGYNAKATKNLPNTGLLKIKIVNFLHQYALRSPSIFFKNFKLSDFKSYLDETEIPNKTFEEFSILDLLFKLYLETCKTKEVDNRLSVLLQRLMLFLLQVRFTCKDEDILAKIKELRQKNIEPLRHEILKEVLSITERYSDVAEDAEIKRYCKWLEYLAHMPQYRKEVLLACDKLLTCEIMEDKKVIGQLIKESKESFEKGTEPTSAEKYYYNSFLTKLSLQTPEVLNILSYILNEVKDIEPEIKLFIQETQTFNNSLRDISTFYMEALELISQLVDKGFIESLTNLQGKLKKMMEVPVQYYINLSKMKEIGEQEIEYPPELIKISSDVDSPNPMVSLARSYSSARQDNSNFQEILVHWMKKHRGFINSIFKASQTEENLSLWIVKKFPWILDFNVKEKILRDAFAEREREEEDNQEEDDEEITFYIRRKHILEDTLYELEKHNSLNDNVYRFRIEFVNEPGVDQGGLKKEWLTLLSKEIFDPQAGLFKLSPNMRSVHPSPLSLIQPGAMSYFSLAGVLVGLAIKEKFPIDVNFSKSFLKIVMGTQPNLNDLEDIDPEFMQSLSWMLNNDVTDLEQPFIYELDLFGSKVVQELKEDGMNVTVDEDNKKQYISRVCLARTLKEVEQPIERFKKGFYKIVPEHLAKLFASGELEILISGKSELDLQDLMKNTTYRDLNKESLLVQWFWEIVATMDQIMLANLLFFITGSSKVPHGGFKDAPITLIKGSNDTSSLPIAHTCFSELEIPLYESKEQFHEKLLLAISEGKEGFYIA